MSVRTFVLLQLHQALCKDGNTSSIERLHRFYLKSSHLVFRRSITGILASAMQELGILVWVSVSHSARVRVRVGVSQRVRVSFSQRFMLRS